MSNFDGFSSDLSLTHFRFVWFEKSHNMLSLQEGEEREVCNLSNSLEDEVGGGVSTVQVPHHVTTQPHLPTTPHKHYNHKNSLPRIMWKDGKKKSPYTCLFLCLCFLFIVLNEMSPLVSFLVGHVRNYFQKFVCMRTMSDQSMTFSETTKWGTIHLECGNSFTRSLSLEKHLAWTHGRLCHPPLLSLIWGQASSLVDLVWRVQWISFVWCVLRKTVLRSLWEFW